MYYLVKELPGHDPVKIDEDKNLQALKDRIFKKFSDKYSVDEVQEKNIFYDSEAGYFVMDEFYFKELNIS